MIKKLPFTDKYWEGKLTVAVGHPDTGWILLWIGASYCQNVTIFTSDVIDPYPDIVDWLMEIAINQLPCEVVIWEESNFIILYAEFTDANEIGFRVYELNTNDENIILRSRVTKNQLISSFVSAIYEFTKKINNSYLWNFGFICTRCDLIPLQNYLRDNQE